MNQTFEASPFGGWIAPFSTATSARIKEENLETSSVIRIVLFHLSRHYSWDAI